MNIVDETADLLGIHPVDVIQGAVNNLPSDVGDCVKVQELYEYILRNHRIPHWVEAHCISLHKEYIDECSAGNCETD